MVKGGSVKMVKGNLVRIVKGDLANLQKPPKHKAAAAHNFCNISGTQMA